MESVPGSWRVSVDLKPTILREALFLRDAAGLFVESTSEIPPRLRGDIPDRSGYLSMEWRASAGVRWTSWWHELVRWAALPRLASLLSDSAFTRRPPSGSSFSPPPPFPVGDQEDESSVIELQRVLELAAQWSSTPRTELRQTRGPSLFTLDDNERIGSIARATAARLEVPLEAMRAAILTLAVSGEWSHQPLEGVLLCSEGAMENEVLFATLLADTFVSGLYRQEEFTTPDRPAPSPAFRSILNEPLHIADGRGITLRLEGVYLGRAGGFELEISRSEGSSGPPPRPYGHEGQPSDPERFANHFSGLEVDVHFEPESLAEVSSTDRPVSVAILNRFWRRGRGPNTLWFWVRVESPRGNILEWPRGHVTVTTTWPECEIDHRSVEFELKESDPSEEINRRTAW
jgi:hypothetical protein